MVLNRPMLRPHTELRTMWWTYGFPPQPQFFRMAALRSDTAAHRISNGRVSLARDSLPSQARLILLTIAIEAAVPPVVPGVIGDGALHAMSPFRLTVLIPAMGTAAGLLSISLAGLMVPAPRHRLAAAAAGVFPSNRLYLTTAMPFFERKMIPNPIREGGTCLPVGCAVAVPANGAFRLLGPKGPVLSLYPRPKKAIFFPVIRAGSGTSRP
jgi:hypothetical protein